MLGRTLVQPCAAWRQLTRGGLGISRRATRPAALSVLGEPYPADRRPSPLFPYRSGWLSGARPGMTIILEASWLSVDLTSRPRIQW